MATAAKSNIRKVTTPVFRASFAWVFTPQPPMKDAVDKTPKYGVTMLFDEAARKTEEFKKMKELAAHALREKFGDKCVPDGKGWFMNKDTEKPYKNPFRNGKEKAELEGYKDMVFATATTKQQPGLVDAQRQRIISEQDFYSGCYARATVTAYGYDKAGNQGVAFGLQNVQMIRKGEAFSGRTAAEDDFDSVDDDAFGAVEGNDSSFLD